MYANNWQAVIIDTEVFVWGEGWEDSIAVDNNGVVHIGYSIFKSSDIFTDEAVGYTTIISTSSFEKELVKGNPYDWLGPSYRGGFILVDSENIPYMIYTEIPQAQPIIHFTKKQTTWQDIGQISNEAFLTATIFNDKIYGLTKATDDNGNTYLKIYKLDNSPSLIYTSQMIGSYVTIYEADLCVNNNGIYFVALVSATETSEGYYYKYLYKTPSEEKIIEKQLSFNYEKAIEASLDKNGTLYICYFTTATQNIYGVPTPTTKIVILKPTENYEQTIEESSIFGRIIVAVQDISNIVFDRNGNPHVCYIYAYTSSGMNGLALRYAYYDGTKWNVEDIDKIEFTQLSVLYSYPVIAVDKNNIPHICFTKTDGNIYYAVRTQPTPSQPPSDKPPSGQTGDSKEDTVKAAELHFGTKSAIKKKISELKEKLSQ